VWKMGGVRHACRTVVADRLQFFLVLMRAHDHAVRTYMKLIATAIPRLIRNPGADVHVLNTDGCYVRFAPGQTVFHPLQKDGIKTAGLIMRVTGYTRETSPLTCPLAQNAILTARLLWPIQDRCVFCNKGRSRSQGVRYLAGVRDGTILRYPNKYFRLWRHHCKRGLFQKG
jgi:hypothetical protein